MQTGKLRLWLDSKGFGFIQPIGGGADIFLHRTHVLGAGIDPYALRGGDLLSYEVGLDRNDRPTAINVQLVGQ